MATITQAYQESRDEYATWTHVFQSQNTTWLPFDTRQIQGVFFITLQGQPMNAWNTQIPPGSTIVSATMEVVASQNSGAAAYSAQLNSPRRSTGGLAVAPMQLPFSAFRGWRRAQWHNMDITILSTTPSTIASPTGGVNNSNIATNQLISGIGGATISQKQRAAQPFTVPLVGNPTLASAFVALSRVGLPAPGAMRCRIQGVTTDVNGQDIPDGIDFAVSASIAYTAAALNPAVTDVLFPFAGAPILTPGADYFFVFETDNVPIGNQFMEVRVNDVFLSTGRTLYFGDGVGNDWQNYPGQVDANQWHTSGLNFVASDTQWDFPQFFIGATYVSPDISALVQAQIDDPGYTADAGIIVSVTRGSVQVANRVWRSNGFITPNNGPVLRITYEEPVVVVVDGMADPTLTGRHRARDFKEPFDLGYWRTKYGKRDQQSPPVPEVDPALDLVELNAYLDEALAVQARFNDERARIFQELAEKGAEAELERQNDILQARVARLDQEQRELEVALDLAAQQLEEVHEAVRLVLERQRKQRNAEAAIAATMSLYF